MSDWPRQSPVDVALRGACPRCGRGRLFRGVLDVVERCSECDLDLRGHDDGAGPAVFVILGLGAIVMILVFWVEFRFEPPWWVHVLIWGALTVALAVWMLRVLKGLLRVVERCETCGLDLRGNDAGDGPAVFVILGLGAIVMIGVFWVEFRFEPPWWVH